MHVYIHIYTYKPRTGKRDTDIHAHTHTDSSLQRRTSENFYRVVTLHKISDLYRLFSTKEPNNTCLFCRKTPATRRAASGGAPLRSSTAGNFYDIHWNQCIQ